MYERYSVTRSNMGYRHPVTVLITYPSAASLPSTDFLTTRVAELQQHFPLLAAKILGRKTREPYFQQSAPSTFADVVTRSTLTGEGDLRESILASENIRTAAIEEPGWHVALFESPGCAYLALSVDHAYLDGRGIFHLLDALLQPNIDHLPFETLSNIAKLEDTHDIRPGFTFIAGVIWTELIVPKLPLFLQRYLATSPIWPYSIAKTPTACSSGVTVVDLSPRVIPALKKVGRAHRVDTIHPILLVSLGLAVGKVVKAQALRVQTPGALRDTSLAHGYCTGGYVSSTVIPITVSNAFWPTTVSVAKYLNSSSGKKRSLETIGSLAYIPDPSPDISLRDTVRPTGWEKFFFDKMQRGMDGLGVSNIGQVGLPAGAADLVWSQAASPMGPALEVNIAGHEAGLRATMVWREGAILSQHHVEDIVKVWTRMLQELTEEMA